MRETNIIEAAASFGIGIMALFIYVFFLAAIVAFGIWIWWRIFKKMGMSGAWSLLMLFPLTNFIMKIILAFSEWPIEKKLKEPRNLPS